MTRTALAIRHVPFEDLGAFAAPIAEAGYALRILDAGIDDLRAPDLPDADLLVVLGGPIGAYEDDKYPFLADEIRLIERRLAARRPTLGICLDAQLMARALGARVYPGFAKEIGWAPIALTEAGEAGPLRHLEGGPVLHWHGDTFDLPDGAEQLASTDVCQNQAFAYGANTLAFQFHPEVEAEGFERWLIGHAVEIAGAGLSVPALRADTGRFAEAAAARGRACLAEWLRDLEL